MHLFITVRLFILEGKLWWCKSCILSKKDKSINVKVSYQYLFLKTLSGVSSEEIFFLNTLSK